MAKGVWTIHGRRYDLTAFVDQHPGGPFALQLGRNRDCTGLFESYHIFADESKLQKIMARYELPESKAIVANIKPTENATGLIFRDAFHEDVKQMCRDYFKEAGVSHKMKTWVFVCTILTILVEIVALIMVLTGYRVGLVLLPICGTLLTFNVSHEASHFGVSSRPLVNRIFTFTSAPMCFNSTAWYIQHIVQHHVYTNDEPDVDLYHFLPVARTTRFSKYIPAFSWQWLTVWLALPTSVVHLLFVVPMDLLTGYMDPVTKTRRYEQCENVNDFVAYAYYGILIEFILSFSYIIVNFICHGFAKGLWFLAFTYTFSSVIFISVTQGAHLQERSQVDNKEKDDFSWAKRQVSTAVNFKPDSIFWNFATGGLNVQALHHILPPVSASHLRDMYPKFREVCKKHNVELKESANIVEFFGGFLGWVSELSHEDLALDGPIAGKAKSS